jgi:O-antigen/teichoic acid export membrane protein
VKTLLLRFGGFAFLPLLSAIAPLLLLPIISRVGGVDGWASVATAQAVGSFGAVAVSFGWNIAGPPQVAKLGPGAQSRDVYARSFGSRMVVFLVLAPILAAVSAFLSAPAFVVDSIAMTTAMLFLGLSPGWYAIGMGQPRFLAVYEAFPKLAATVIAAAFLLLGFSIWTYPALLLIASAGGLLAFHKSQMGSWWPIKGQRAGVKAASIRTMVVPALVDLTGASYASTPLPIVSATGGLVATSMFASADKLYRYGMFGISALANALQAWVLENGSRRPLRRQLAAITAHLVLGLLGLVFLAVAGPLATEILFGSAVAAAAPVCFWFGVSYLSLSAATPLMRNLILPNGRASIILRATVVSAVVGIPTMIVGGMTIGGAGVAFGLALSESLILICILPEALRQLKNLR